MTAPARPISFRHGLKKPEIAYLPTDYVETRGGSRRRPCFRAAVPIWDGDRGNSRGCPANPHTFLCTDGRQGNPRRRTVFAKGRQSCRSLRFLLRHGRACPDHPCLVAASPGSRFAYPGVTWSRVSLRSSRNFA